jgi:hypothetical protein
MRVPTMDKGHPPIQFRQLNLANHARFMAMDAARTTSDEIMVASSAFDQGWVLIRQGRFDEASDLALRAAGSIEPRLSEPPSEKLTTWGWLMLIAPVRQVRMSAWIRRRSSFGKPKPPQRSASRRTASAQWLKQQRYARELVGDLVEKRKNVYAKEAGVLANHVGVAGLGPRLLQEVVLGSH